MKINIQLPANSTRTRILAAFMAFLILALTFEQAFVGWDFGTKVQAANYGTDVYTGVSSSTFMTSGTASTDDSRYVYSGKMKTNDVTLFDYVTDNETMGKAIDLGIGDGGYHDPYGSFNGTISGNLASPASENITIIIETHYSSSDTVTMYSEDNSGNHGVGWPGKPMTYIGGEKSAWKYVISTTNSSYLGFTPTKIKFHNQADKNMPGPGTDDYYRCTYRAGYTYYISGNGPSQSTLNNGVYEVKGSENIYNNSTTCAYTNPLYLGMFYITNNASSYDSSSIITTATAKNYNNFHWLTNMGLKNIGNAIGTNNQEHDEPLHIGDYVLADDENGYKYRGTTAVQGLVENILTKDGALSTETPEGKLRQGTTELPFFSKAWAADHPTLLRYYDHNDTDNKIAFPFYEVRTPISGTGANESVSVLDPTKVKSGDYAKYYQFSSKDTNLFFEGDASNRTGYFKESDVTVHNGDNPGFFPFNNTDAGDAKNLGFGTKFEMQFTLQPDGCVGVIDANGEDRDGTYYPARVHTTFEFQGDDDLWVFIDGKLVLDMGGDHYNAKGKIDFATGKATVDKAVTYSTSSPNNVNDLAADIETNKEYYFKDKIDGYNSTTQKYSNKPHTMTIFYMERGMGDSNLLIRYNYSTLNNFSKMKIQEITAFDGVNPGLLDLTKKAAENDVFKYTVYNTGTNSADVKAQAKVYPDNAVRTRSNQGIDTILTTADTGNPTTAPYNYSPPASILTEGTVANTSYIWVDDFANMNHSTQGTGKTHQTGGYFFLMYGTEKNTATQTDDMESSAEFGKQFSRYSTMRVQQVGLNSNDELYTPTRNGNNAVTFTTSGRMVNDYYTSANPYIYSTNDINDHMELPGNNATFSFRNDIRSESATDANEIVAVQMTEVFKNTVRSGQITVEKSVANESTNTEPFKFKLTLTNVYGVAGNNPTGYSNITISGAVDADGAPITHLADDGTFYVKPGPDNKAVINGIPYNTRYKVEEITSDFSHTTGTESAALEGDLTGSGTISKDMTVVNTRLTNSLVLKKALGTNYAENGIAASEAFTFNVTLNIPNSVNLGDCTIQNGSTNITSSITSGVAFPVTVTAGTTGVTLTGIPRGTTYTVVEADSKGTSEVIESNTSGTISGSATAEITNNYPKVIDVTAEKKAGSTGLPNAELDLYYKENIFPSAYTMNDPFITPTRQITVTIPTEPTAPAVAPVTVTETTQKKTYSYSYTTEETPSVTPTSWILPRSDNDYIYFRDYNSGSPALSDYISFAHPGSGNSSAAQNAKRSWLKTELKYNEQTQKLEIDYDHKYWFEAQFTGPGKSMAKYNIWERFVDRYNGQDTVVWKIQPPDGYNKVRFCMYENGHCIRTTEEITFRLGEIYEKTDWGGTYKNEGGVDCYFNVPLNDEAHNNWATHRTTAGADNSDHRMDWSATSSMQQAERYTPTHQKITFHCNSNVVWHNIHIQFFKNTGTDANPNYQLIGQEFPGYMMEPYAYAGDSYRIGNYLTYELTIPEGATHFRVNNGVSTDPYNFSSNYTKLFTASDSPGRKNYANYFSINGDSNGHDVTSGTPVTLNYWDNYPPADERNKTYSDNEVDSDYDYIYFEAPTSWGNHVYAYFYGGGELREDNWRRAVYSIWPGVTPVGTEFVATNGGSNGHSDIYNYPLTGSIANPDNTFVDKNSGTTVYKFKVPMGERRNYSKVIFNNGLKSQLSTGGASSTQETIPSITYHRGYLYKADGSSYQHYENKPTTQYEQRGDNLYIMVPSTHATGVNGKTWDDLHIKFYNSSGTQILQGGQGYVMKYAGVKTVSGTDYTYYTIPIPKDAKKFSLNNGKDSYSSNTGTNNNLSTGIYDIPRYDSTLVTSNVTTADVTKGDVTYKLTNTSLEQTSPKITLTETIDATVTTGTFTPENPSPRGDHLYIKDAGDILNDIPTIKFYEFENSSTEISTSLTAVKLNDSPEGTDWYSIGIPTNASYFTMTYNNGTSSVTTTKTQIYAKSTGANQLNATPGDMYYDTTADELTITWPTFTSDADDLSDEQYPGGQRGDNLYVVNSASMTNPKVIFYNSNGIPIVNNAGNTEISLKPLGTITAPESGQAPIDGKTSNDANARGNWYRAAIPYGAASFVVKYTNGSTVTTGKEKIYEKSDKLKRYSNDYTLDGMQYRITGSTATILYPIFTEDPDYSVDVGGGQSIGTNGSTVRVDATKVSNYSGYNAATAATSSSNTTPALYQTSTNDVTYKWGGTASTDNYIYLETTDWWDTTPSDGSEGPKIYFSNDGTTWTSGYTMTLTNGDEHPRIWKYQVPEDHYTKVKFRAYPNGSEMQNGSVIKTFAEGCSTLPYGNGFYYKQDKPVGGQETKLTLDHIVGYEKQPTKWLKFKNSAGWTVSSGSIKAEFLDGSNQRIGSIVDMTLDGDTWKFDMSTVPAFGSATKVVFSNNGSNSEYVEATLQGDAPKKGWGYTYTCTAVADDYVYVIYEAWCNDSTKNVVICQSDTANTYNNWNHSMGATDKSTNFLGSGKLGAKFKVDTTNRTYMWMHNGDVNTHTSQVNISGKNNGKGLVYIVSNNGSWTETTDYPISSGDYTTSYSGPDTEYVVVQSAVTVSYQPEDRYGMISNANGTTSPTAGTNDADNFIKIVTNMEDPYIHFYSDTAGTTAIGTYDPNTADAIPLKYTAVMNGSTAVTDSGQPGDGSSANPYIIRLPKTAKSFKLADGTSGTPGSAIPLEESITVKNIDGSLYEVPAENAEPYTTLANYRHAGTTFYVDPDGELDVTAVTKGMVLRTGYSYPKSAITDPLEPRSDIDYVYFTDTSTGNSWGNTVYAYFYGGEDGEYTAWPGVRASTTDKAPLVYTNADGQHVFMFQLPKVSDGKYPYVIFNTGGADNRKETQAIRIMNNGETAYTAGGKNYRLNDSSVQYGTSGSTSVDAYATTETTKTSDPTVNYSSNKYIYIINNGTKKLSEDGRDTLDDLHVVFYDNGGTVVGTSGGYNPDRLVNNDAVVTYTETDNTIGSAGEGDVYRIAVPSNAAYFQITNGDNDHQIVRHSEKKPITANGLYRFVPKATNAADYIEESTVPADIKTATFLLDLVNEIKNDDEDTPEIRTTDVKLATIVTDANGQQDYIKWLKDDADHIDTNYLRHTSSDVYPASNQETVKVVKPGDYYWVESKAPAGYELNENPVEFTLNGTETSQVKSTVLDDPLPTGSLKVTKTVTSEDELPSGFNGNTEYTFSITFTNANGFAGYNNITQKLGTAAATNISSSFGSNTTVTLSNLAIKAGAENALVINGLPQGTTYQVTEVTTQFDSNWSQSYKLNGATDATDGAVTTESYITDLTDGNTVEFINTYAAPSEVTLSLKKTVDGTLPTGMDADTAFKFSVTLTNLTEMLTTSSIVSGDYVSVPTTISNNTAFDVMLKDGQTVTLTLPAGVGYTVVETSGYYKYNSGTSTYDTTATAYTGTRKSVEYYVGSTYSDVAIDSNATAADGTTGTIASGTKAIEVKNIYPTVHDLLLQKRTSGTVPNGLPNAQGEYTFTVTLTKPTDTTTYGDLDLTKFTYQQKVGSNAATDIPSNSISTVTNGISFPVTIKAGTGDTHANDITIKGIPEGVVYAVAETAGSTGTVVTNGVTVVYGDDNNPLIDGTNDRATVTNTYPDFADLTITKQLARDNITYLPEGTHTYEFTVTLSRDDALDLKVYPIAVGGTAQTGNWYTVDNGAGSGTITVSIPVTVGANEAAVSDVSKVITGIPKGTKITVTETARTDASTASFSTDGSNYTNGYTYPAENTVSLNSDSTIYFKNTYHQTGSLTLTKEITGVRPASVPNANYEYTLSGTLTTPAGGSDLRRYTPSVAVTDDSTVTFGTASEHSMTFEAKIIVPANATSKSVTINGLPADTLYTVSEDSGSQAGTVAIGNTPCVEGNVTNATAIATGATITNHYPTEHTLTLQKTVSGTPPTGMTADNSTKFKFSVVLEAQNGVALNGYSISVSNGTSINSYVNDKYNFDVYVPANGTVVISNIPYGTKYSVSEDTAHYYTGTNNEQHDHPANTRTNTPASYSNQILDGNKTATITNTYPTVGKLNLKKEMEAGSAETSNYTQFPYTVTLTTDPTTGIDLTQYISKTPADAATLNAITQIGGLGVVSVSAYQAHSITFTVNVTSASDVLIENIPYGTTYSVSEANPPATGWTKVSERRTKQDDTAIADSAERKINSTTPYVNYIFKNVHKADLVLKKAVDGSVSGQLNGINTNSSYTNFTYEVTLTPPNDMSVETFAKSYLNLTNEQWTTLSANNDTVGNYTRVPATGTMTGIKVTVNNITSQTGTGQKSITGLPYGTTFHVVEAAASQTKTIIVAYDIDGTACADAYAESSIGGSKTVTVTNTYSMLGNLVLKKRVVNENNPSNTPNANHKYTFEITFTNPSDTATYGTLDINKYTIYKSINGSTPTAITPTGSTATARTYQVEIEAGSASDTTKDITLSGIPYGVTYAVEEVSGSKTQTSTVTYQIGNNSPTTTSISGQTIGARSDTTVITKYVTVNNEYYDVGDLTITKEIESNTWDNITSVPNFTFHVTLTPPANATLVDRTGASNTAGYQIKADESGSATLVTFDAKTTYEFDVTIPGHATARDSAGYNSTTHKKTVTISGIPYGTKYTITEVSIPDNWSQVGSGVYGKTPVNGEYVFGTGTGSDTYDAKNAKKADLELQKALTTDTGSGNDSTAFTYTVALTLPTGYTPTVSSNTISIGGTNLSVEKYNSGTWETQSYSNASVNGQTATFKVQVSKNNKVKIEGLPYGTTYTVTESSTMPNTGDANTAWVKVGSQSGTVISDSDSKTATITNGLTGSLTVHKELAGTPLSGDHTDYTIHVTLVNDNLTQAQWNAFKDKITDVSNKTLAEKTGQSGKYTLSFDVTVNVGTSVNTGSTIVKGIPYGTSCTVSETGTSATPSYCATQSGTYETSSPSVTVNSTTSAQDLYVMNTFDQTGSLTISKALLKEPSGSSASLPASLSGQSFVMHVTLHNDNDSLESITLPTVTNSYLSNGKHDRIFDVEVTEGSSVSITGLPYGTVCTVTEEHTTVTTNHETCGAGTQNAKQVQYYVNNSDTPTASVSETIASENKSVTVAVKNTYYVVHDLVLKKTVNNPINSVPSDAYYKYTVTLDTTGLTNVTVGTAPYTLKQTVGTSSTETDVSVSSNSFVVYVKAGADTNYVTVKGIPHGATYTVVEDTAYYYTLSGTTYTEHPITNTGLTAAYSPSGINTTAATLNDNGEVTVTNTYLKTAPLTLEKTVYGSAHQKTSQTVFTFKVELTEPANVDYYPTNEVTNYDVKVNDTTSIKNAAGYGFASDKHTFYVDVTAGSNNTVQITGIPVGSQYTVTEVNKYQDSGTQYAAMDDATHGDANHPQVTYSPANISTTAGTVNETTAQNTDPNHVTVTNTYRKVTMTKKDAKQTSLTIDGAKYVLLRLDPAFATYFNSLDAAGKASLSNSLKSKAYTEWTYDNSGTNDCFVKVNSTVLASTVQTTSSGTVAVKSGDMPGGIVDGGDYFFFETKAATGYDVDNSITADKIIHISGSGTNSDYTYSAASAAYTDPRQTKKLTLSKQYGTDSTDEAAVSFPYQVSLTRTDSIDLTQYITSLPSGATSVTNNANNITFKVNVTKGTDVEIDNIPYGTNYEVQELVNDSNMPENWIKVGDSNLSGSITTDNAAASVTNVKTNTLTLQKAMNGGTTGQNDTLFKYDVTLVAPAGMTFTYTAQDGLKINGNTVTINDLALSGNSTEVFETAPSISSPSQTVSFTLRTSANQPRTISGLPYGTTYYVSEQAETGWVKLTDTTAAAENTPAYEQTGEIGATASSATITNAKTGEITIYKKLSGSSIPSSILGNANYYTMTVTMTNSNVDDWSKYSISAGTPDSNGNVTVTLAVPSTANGTTSATITGIPYGTQCVVNETAPSTGEFSTTYCLTADGTYNSADASKTATVNNSTSAPTVYVKNDYSNVIKLTLTKEVENQPSSLSSKTYKFRITLTNSNGITAGDLSFSSDYDSQKPQTITSETPFEIDMTPGTSLEISGLPINTLYTVQEVIPSGGEGYTTSVKQNTATEYTTGYSANGSLTASAQSDTVSIKNTYPETYDLTLKKIVVGKLPDSMGTNPKFKFHVVLTAPTSPAGVELNDYSITGATLGTYDGTNHKYEFDVQVPVYDTENPTTSVVEITGIPEGTTYTVTEDTSNYYKNVSGTYTVTAHPANTRLSNPTGGQSTATALNADAEVAVTNTYPETHSLTLNKVLHGGSNPSSTIANNTDYYFRVTLTEPSGVKFASGTGTGFTPNYNIMVGGSSGTNAVVEANYTSSTGILSFTVAVPANGSNVVITGIPNNTQYTVQEVNASGSTTALTGHKITGNVSTETALTADDTVTITNTYRKIELNKKDSIISTLPVSGATYYLLKLKDAALTGENDLVSAFKTVFEGTNSTIADLKAAGMSSYCEVVKIADGTADWHQNTDNYGNIVIRDADVQGGLADGTYLFYEAADPTNYTRDNTYDANNLIVISSANDANADDSLYGVYSKNYTNVRKTGNLVLKKLVKNGSPSVTVTYNVTLTSPSLSLADYNNNTPARIAVASPSGTSITNASTPYGYANGEYYYTFSVPVTSGADVTISGIPYGVTCNVSEGSLATGWEQVGNDTSYTDGNQVVGATDVTATITNMKRGSLDLEKALATGTDPDKDVNGTTTEIRQFRSRVSRSA